MNKTYDITIHTLIGKVEIKTTKDIAKIKKQVTKALIEAVNDFNLIEPKPIVKNNANSTGLLKHESNLPGRPLSFRDYTIDKKQQNSRVAFNVDGICCGGPSLLFEKFGLKMGMTVEAANKKLKKFKINIGEVVATS